MKKIGVISAMNEEIKRLISELKNDECLERGMRQYHQGKLWGIPTVAVFSRWGKVAAATTTLQLIIQYNVDEVVLIGVAGSIDPSLNIGDIVVAKNLYQHDLDARPIFDQHEVPLLNVKSFPTDKHLRKLTIKTSENYIEKELSSSISPSILQSFGISMPKVIEADIASGDKFIATRNDREELKKCLPSVACVEMEGAAVAQVCYEYKIPLTVIRIISDTADEKAEFDFPSFITDFASEYCYGILKNIYSGRT